MVKRAFDMSAAFCGLVVLLPLLLIAMLIVWLEDFSSPLYIAPRARSRSVTFNMVKLRSMVKNADQKGGATTSSSDMRITWVGKLIRKTKFDEVLQLWNVLLGDMSLVGPRPQVMRDVLNFYTDEECRLFDVRPGITDFASIVFADEGEILKNSTNPALDYNRLIRPWKSRLGLFYVDHHSVWIDLQLIIWTVTSIISRPRAIRGVQLMLAKLGADPSMIQIAGRANALKPYPPPGSTTVESRY